MKSYSKLMLSAVCLFALVSCSADGAAARSDRYIDASKASFISKYKQETANSCSFIDGSEKPYVYYDKYATNEGEEFIYDENGRLCRYKNIDSIFFGKTSSEVKHEMTDEEVEAYCYDIAEYYLEPGYKFETSFNADTCELYVEGVNEKCSDLREDAVVRVNRSGDICSIKVSYNTLKQPVDDAVRAYFDEKVNDYAAAECERLNDDHYEYGTARFRQVDSALYAIYTCTFTNADGAVFCESVGFSKTLEE